MYIKKLILIRLNKLKLKLKNPKIIEIIEFIKFLKLNNYLNKFFFFSIFVNIKYNFYIIN
jgi:hypothetical protein